MPLPKDMSACMHKVSDEFPQGRSKKPMSAKRAHRQHVAMCMRAQRENLDISSFINFLFEEANVQYSKDHHGIITATIFKNNKVISKAQARTKKDALVKAIGRNTSEKK